MYFRQGVRTVRTLRTLYVHATAWDAFH